MEKDIWETIKKKYEMTLKELKSNKFAKICTFD